MVKKSSFYQNHLKKYQTKHFSGAKLPCLHLNTE